MKSAEIVGYFGAFFLTITLIPQLRHTIKTKKVDGLSSWFLYFDICYMFQHNHLAIY